jgi:hypothetical protein
VVAWQTAVEAGIDLNRLPGCAAQLDLARTPFTSKGGFAGRKIGGPPRRPEAGLRK